MAVKISLACCKTFLIDSLLKEAFALSTGEKNAIVISKDSKTEIQIQKIKQGNIL